MVFLFVSDMVVWCNTNCHLASLLPAPRRQYVHFFISFAFQSTRSHHFPVATFTPKPSCSAKVHITFPFVFLPKRVVNLAFSFARFSFMGCILILIILNPRLLFILSILIPKLLFILSISIPKLLFILSILIPRLLFILSTGVS